MKPTIPYIQEKFDTFNRSIFGGKLPPVPISLSRAKSYVGLCVYKTRRRPFGRVEYYDFRLRFSTRIDLPESVVEDTVIHEMIHYYIRLNRIQDTSVHGAVFREMMERINREFGRHVTVSHRPTREQREEAVDKRPKWHVVAIVSFKDGREGVKILPRIPRRVTAYDRALKRSGQIAGIEYYLENDPWFNRFPSSSAFNVVFTDMAEFRSHLSGKMPL